MPLGNLELLLDLSPHSDRRRWRTIFGLSLTAHLISFAVFMTSPEFVSQTRPLTTKRRVVPLYLPPQLLTQRAPNRVPPSPSVDVASLTSPAPSTRRAPHFELPDSGPGRKTATPSVAPAPAITAPAPAAAPGAISGLAQAPPPPEPAKQPFQNVGQEDSTNDAGKHTLAVPKSDVASIVKSLGQHSAGGHMVVSDAGSPGSAGTGASPHAEVELQSDPQGADLRQYLMRILTIVRSNWRHVLPESARMGTLQGSTVIQFIINRDGSIPKLVTADESGIRALDTAAVAGLSMSNPLPPLPPDFKGQQVRVAFTFSVQGKQ